MLFFLRLIFFVSLFFGLVIWLFLGFFGHFNGLDRTFTFAANLFPYLFWVVAYYFDYYKVLLLVD